ncbi:hypothetical protein D9M70_476790 [compost metagenome]
MAALGQIRHLARQFFDSRRPLGPMPAEHGVGTECRHIVLDRLDLGLGVGGEVVDRDDRGNAELLDVLHMAPEVGTALAQGLQVFLAEIVLLHAAIHLDRSDGGDDHRGIGLQPRLAALDVEEFFCTEIGAEAGFRHDIVGELQRRRRRDHRIAAMRDVGEGTAMHEGRIVFQCLHQVRLHRVLEQHRHRAIGLDVTRKHRALVASVADDDIAEALLEILQIGCQAEDGHDLGCNGDVETGLARITIRDTTERSDNAAQCPVVHVHNATPGDAADVDVLLVAPVDVIVEQRREQIVR